MSAIKFSLTSSQDKDLDDLTKTEKQMEEEEPEDDDVSGLKSMSPLRLSMFILSILVSILACCVFMWVIPCDLATCSAATSHDIRSTNVSMENVTTHIITATMLPVT